MIVYFQKIFFQYYWLGAVLTSLIIFLLSSVSTLPQSPVSIPFLDKVVHVLLYVMLGFCYLCGFTKGFRENKLKRGAAAFFAASFFGALDEYHQSFVFGRFPEFLDWIADLIGVICSFVFWILFYFFKKTSY